MSATFPVLPTSVGLKLGGSGIRATRRHRPTFGGLVPPSLLVRRLCSLGLTLMASVRVCSAGIFVKGAAIGCYVHLCSLPAMRSTAMLARVRMRMEHFEVWTVCEMACWAGAWHPRAHSWVPLPAARASFNKLGLGAGGLGITPSFSWVPCWILFSAAAEFSFRRGNGFLFCLAEVRSWFCLAEVGSCCGFCLAEVRSCSLRSARPSSLRRRRLLQLLVVRARCLQGAVVLQVPGWVFQRVLRLSVFVFLARSLLVCVAGTPLARAVFC